MDTSQNVMMESIALSELNVIEDDREYVFVNEDEAEFDDDSYDHCDLSPNLSCATSVATEFTLKDLNLSLIDEGVESSMVSLEEGRDDSNSNNVMLDLHTGEIEQRTNDPEVYGEDLTPMVECCVLSTKKTSRLSNKKRRKKLKMMKKAAATAAALAESNQNANLSSNSDDVEQIDRRSKTSFSKKLRKSRLHNMAVACAHESLMAYREEVRLGKQKKSLVNYVSPL